MLYAFYDIYLLLPRRKEIFRKKIFFSDIERSNSEEKLFHFKLRPWNAEERIATTKTCMDKPGMNIMFLSHCRHNCFQVILFNASTLIVRSVQVFYIGKIFAKNLNISLELSFL